MSNSSEIGGFDFQSNWAGNCAQRSLIHSLLLLGIPISERVAHDRTGVSKYKTLIQGTSLSSLTKAIKRCDCIPYIYKDSNEKIIRTKIDEFLINGMPVIVNAEEGTHWGVIASKESRDNYYWIDSNASGLYGRSPWAEIRDWMEHRSYYLMIGLRPKDDECFNHSIVRNFDEVYSYFDDDDLAEYWGWYLDDLSTIFDSPVESTQVISPKVFFAKYNHHIIEHVFLQHGEIGKKYIRWELSNYEKVATAHRFTVSRSKEIEAAIGLTAAMAYTVL